MADIGRQEPTERRLSPLLAHSLHILTFNNDWDLTGEDLDDQRLFLDRVTSRTRRLRENADEASVWVAPVSQNIEPFRATIVSQATDIDLNPVAGLLRLAGTSVPSRHALQAPTETPEQLYDRAQADLASGQYDLAIHAFEAYIKLLPRSEMADEAQYQVGEAYFAAGRLVNAVSAYEHVLLNYPDGSAVPAALYKRGVALEKLGETRRARQAFEYVLKQFPGSSIAVLAKRALDRSGSRPAR